MEGFTAANRAAERADSTGVDPDTGALRNIFYNRRRRGINGIKAVAAFD